MATKVDLSHTLCNREWQVFTHVSGLMWVNVMDFDTEDEARGFIAELKADTPNGHYRLMRMIDQTA